MSLFSNIYDPSVYQEALETEPLSFFIQKGKDAYLLDDDQSLFYWKCLEGDFYFRQKEFAMASLAYKEALSTGCKLNLSNRDLMPLLVNYSELLFYLGEISQVKEILKRVFQTMIDLKYSTFAKKIISRFSSLIHDDFLFISLRIKMAIYQNDYAEIERLFEKLNRRDLDSQKKIKLLDVNFLDLREDLYIFIKNNYYEIAFSYQVRIFLLDFYFDKIKSKRTIEHDELKIIGNYFYYILDTILMSPHDILVLKKYLEFLALTDDTLISDKIKNYLKSKIRSHKELLNLDKKLLLIKKSYSGVIHLRDLTESLDKTYNGPIDKGRDLKPLGEGKSIHFEVDKVIARYKQIFSKIVEKNGPTIDSESTHFEKLLKIQIENLPQEELESKINDFIVMFLNFSFLDSAEFFVDKKKNFNINQAKGPDFNLEIAYFLSIIYITKKQYLDAFEIVEEIISRLDLVFEEKGPFLFLRRQIIFAQKNQLRQKRVLM